ncbi:hypothetical protein P4B35_12565 [Pontiellaceae bacterium B12227]|nr:hypothetical protein [Pontiellaceae bacterium B12227]
MKKLAILLLLVLTAGAANALVVFEDDFESYSGGTIWGDDWKPKWDSNTNLVHLQQDLMTATNGICTFDTSKAYRNYHTPSQTGFTVSTNADIYVVTDVRYVYEGGGNITNNFNKAAFGLFFTDTPNWWDGVAKGAAVGNRGGAIGNVIGAAPWVEGWLTHSSLGVNTANNETSNWFKVVNRLVSSNSTIWIQAQYFPVDDQYLDSPLASGILVNSGVADSTTIYAGYSPGWNDVGNTNISSFSRFSAIQYDNFYVGTKPKPIFETFYNWTLESFWVPHTLYAHGGTDQLNGNGYWFMTTNGAYADPNDHFAQHRPGVTNMPWAGPGPDDKDGGTSWRGQYITTNMTENTTDGVRQLDVKESYEVTFDIQLFANGSENAIFLDCFFSEDGTTAGKTMATAGTLGFRVRQTLWNNSFNFGLNSGAAVNDIDLTLADSDIGMDLATTNDLTGDPLFLTYTAKRTTTADVFECGISISNGVSASVYEVSNMLVTNAAAYAASRLWLGFYTAADLSNGQSGLGVNTAGYELDNLVGKILYSEDSILSGFALWADDLGLTGEKTADFDSDGLLDYGEYVFGGNPANSSDQGMQPSIDMGAGYYSYSLIGDDSVVAHILTNVNLTVGSWGTSTTFNVSATDGVLSAYSNMVPASADTVFIKLELE